MPIIIFALTVLIAAAILQHTRLGRYTYAIGGNEEAVRLSGISVDFYKTSVYAICGLTSALGAIVLTSRLNAGESIAGMGYELDVIAAVVIGGTSLMGGRGGVWGTLDRRAADRHDQQWHESVDDLVVLSVGRERGNHCGRRPARSFAGTIRFEGKITSVCSDFRQDKPSGSGRAGKQIPEHQISKLLFP